MGFMPFFLLRETLHDFVICIEVMFLIHETRPVSPRN